MPPASWQKLKAGYRDRGLTARCCGAAVVPVRSPTGWQFFRHKPGTGCAARESLVHIVCKSVMARAADRLPKLYNWYLPRVYQSRSTMTGCNQLRPPATTRGRGSLHRRRWQNGQFVHVHSWRLSESVDDAAGDVLGLQSIGLGRIKEGCIHHSRLDKGHPNAAPA